MSDPLARMVTRVAYMATQLPRFAWYAGHDYVMRRLREPHGGRGTAQARRPRTSACRTNGGSIRDLADLLAQDLANVEAGIYPLPHDHDGTLFTRLRRSRLFFADLPAIHRRRERKDTREVMTAATAGKRPDYYLQNFHYQSGGWLSEDSADRYDTQVEVLFKGSANAMRRQALPPLHEVFAGRDQRRLRLIDIACGTGRFLDFVKQAWPRLPVVGLDLSEAYCRHARRHLARWSRAECRRRQCRSGPGAGRELRRRDVPVHVPRAAAAGAPQRLARMCPRPQTGRPPGLARFAAARGRARLRRDARTVSAELSRAVLRQLSRRGFFRDRAGLRARAPARREGFRVEGDGVRQAAPAGEAPHGGCSSSIGLLQKSRTDRQERIKRDARNARPKTVEAIVRRPGRLRRWPRWTSPHAGKPASCHPRSTPCTTALSGPATRARPSTSILDDTIVST